MNVGRERGRHRGDALAAAFAFDLEERAGLVGGAPAPARGRLLLPHVAVLLVRLLRPLGDEERLRQRRIVRGAGDEGDEGDDGGEQDESERLGEEAMVRGHRRAICHCQS